MQKKIINQKITTIIIKNVETNKIKTTTYYSKMIYYSKTT